MSVRSKAWAWGRPWLSWGAVLLQALLVVVGGVGLAHALAHDGWERVVAVITQGFVVVTALAHPLLGLIVGLVLVPFAPFWHFDIALGAGIPDLSLTRVVVLTVWFITLVRWATGELDFPPVGRTEVGILLFLGGMLLATFHALKGFLFALQTAFDAYVIPMSLYILMRTWVNNRFRLRLALYGLMFIAFYMSVVIMLEAWAGLSAFYPWGRPALYSESLRRITSFFGNPVYHALILAVIFPLVVYEYEVGETPWHRGGALGLLLVILTAYSILYTRAGYLALAIAALLLGIVYPRWRRLILPAAGVALFVLVLFWQRLTHSALFLERLTYAPSLESRGKTIEVAWRLWKESPIFGIGYPNYGVIALQRGYLHRIDDKWTPTPHNTFLGILSQGGLIAFLGYTVMIAAIAREAWTYFRTWMGEEGNPRVWGEHPGYLAWAAFVAFIAYMLIIATIDADPAYYSNMVFYALLGTAFGYLARVTPPRERRG